MFTKTADIISYSFAVTPPLYNFLSSGKTTTPETTTIPTTTEQTAFADTTTTETTTIIADSFGDIYGKTTRM